MTTMLHDVIAGQAGPLTRRLARILGDPHLAEDLCQETLVRAWRSAPRDAAPEQTRAWLHRTATNLALDELRRRRRRGLVALDPQVAAPVDDSGRPVREALAALTPHQRLVLLLRFEAGLSLRELGALLDLSEDAARKRVARARTAFAGALRALEAGETRPTIVVLLGREEPEPYRRWLESAGARVRIIDARRTGLDLAGSDGVVLSGSRDDVDPSLYGQRPDPELGRTDRARDLRDLAALRRALTADLPVVGVCRGPQLLSILFGGTLFQHLPHTAYDQVEHRESPHVVRTASGTLARGVLGERITVSSEHHQGVRRLGRGLRVTSQAPDGLPEAIEVPGRRFALGVQWHPEHEPESPASARLAGALVEAACAA